MPSLLQNYPHQHHSRHLSAQSLITKKTKNIFVVPKLYSLKIVISEGDGSFRVWKKSAENCQMVGLWNFPSSISPVPSDNYVKTLKVMNDDYKICLISTEN